MKDLHSSDDSAMGEVPEVTRRDSLQVAGMGIASMLLPTLKLAMPPQAPSRVTHFDEAPDLLENATPPSPVEMALHRIAFGPRPGDVERVTSMGLENYLHEQLHPVDSEDEECNAALANATLHIEYKAGKDRDISYPAVKEDRPLRTLNQSAEELYMLLPEKGGLDYQERQRPLEEVKAAKFIRAIHSKWQVREVMTDFWHNHFSVDAYVDDDLSKVMFPVYDRTMRKHALGNFRQFLGDIAKSQPMLIYLNNYTSKASPANENYARELFELHTLGAEHYFNDLYQEWSRVPGAAQGSPIGYIDQDVYEAARAFTGWTIANGGYGRGERLPNTGDFLYYDAWHDPYQKRILAQQIDPYQPPMSDGERVLDLVAYHPGTAHFVCKKICKRLVSPNPPESLVKKAVHTWMTYQKDPMQIARTIHTIVMSPEFSSTWAKGIKFPFESTVAYFRATESIVKPDEGLFGLMAYMGESMFNWPTPNGRPYDAQHWTGTMGMLARWNGMLNFTGGQKGHRELPDPLPIPNGAETFDDVVKFWTHRMLGRGVDPDTHQTFVDFVSKPFPNGVPESGNKGYQYYTKLLIALIAMTPDFLVR